MYMTGRACPRGCQLRRVKALRGPEPTLVWAEPVKCAAQLKLTLTDLQKKEDDPRRLVKHILRAMPQFQNVAAQDYVSLYVEEEPRNRIYFGRCVCFFADSAGAHYLAVRWLREVPGVIVDTTTRLQAATPPTSRLVTAQCLPAAY